MPVGLIAAGVAAVGSVAGAVISSNATDRAVSAQQQATAASNSLAQQTYAKNEEYLNPAITRGNQAGGYVADLLGIGGDPTAAKKAFDTFRGSTGYQFQLDQGLKAVNSNAYARGMGDSGATLKALQTRGQGIADSSANNYIAQLTGLQNTGVGAASSLAGVGTNFVNQVTQNNQAQATASGNAALVNGQNLSGAVQNLLNAGAYAYGSSYGSNKAGTIPTPTMSQPVMTGTPYGYIPGGYGRWS